MIDYYRLLDLERSCSPHEIRQRLKEKRRLWTDRQNAPKLEQRHEAANNLQLIPELEKALLNASNRAAYDRELGIARWGGEASSVPSRDGPSSSSGPPDSNAPESSLLVSYWNAKQIVLAGAIVAVLFLAIQGAAKHKTTSLPLGAAQRGSSQTAATSTPSAANQRPAIQSFTADEPPTSPVKSRTPVALYSTKAIAATRVTSPGGGYEVKPGDVVLVEEVHQGRCILDAYETSWVPCSSLAGPKGGWVETVRRSERAIPDRAVFEISNGNMLEAWALHWNGQVLLNGRSLGQVPGSVLKLSTGSPSGAFKLVVAWEQDKGPRRAWIWHAGTTPLGEPPFVIEVQHERAVSDEVYWSPDERYAVIVGASEKQGAVHFFDLQRRRQAEHVVGPYEHGKCEIQRLYRRPATWLSKDRFLLNVKIEENPWEDEGGCVAVPRIVPVEIELRSAAWTKSVVLMMPANSLSSKSAPKVSERRVGAKAESTVSCVLPSGQEMNLSLSDCRSRGGSVYR